MKDLLAMRPFQVIVIVIFGLLAFAGLFLFANYTGRGTGEMNVGTVTIWGTLPSRSIADGLEDMKRGNRSYGGVKYEERPAATFDADLAEAIAAGQGPDLILITQEQLIAHQNKLQQIPYESLPERTYRDGYLPIFELFLTSTGTWGVPVAVDPMVLYYNRPMLASVGVAQAPTTWEGVTGLVALLTRKLPDQTVEKSLLAFGEYENVTNARAVISLLLLQAGTPISTPTSAGQRAALSGGAASESFGGAPAESALAFYTQFANPTKTVYSWNRAMPASRQAFLSGDVALYPGFASERIVIAAGNPNLDFDMAPVPQPQTAQTRITFGNAYVLAIPKASDNKSGAISTALAIGSKSAGTAVAAALGMAPAHRSALKPEASDHYTPIFYPAALISRAWLSPAPAVTDQIFGTMIGNITSGRRDVRAALFTADQALDAAL